jgi:excisionase family DNA binding protein
MARTATTEQVAAALHVGPATVRKYAREHRLPYDVTPGGHRRFDVDEAVAAIRRQHRESGFDRGDGSQPFEAVPYVWIEPASDVAAVAVVTAVVDAEVRVHDVAGVVDDWATETPVV